MKVSVLIITYKRARYLKNALDSLCKQTVKPDEVVIVLKPSNDGSEDVIRSFADRLNIKMLIQEGVGPINAYSQGIKNASGDIILFLDDDAIAEKDWVLKYTRIFDQNTKVGGVTGLNLKARVEEDNIFIEEQPFLEETHAIGFHRHPLQILEDYDEYFSTSGLCGTSRNIIQSSVSKIKSVFFGGLNMGFRSFLIKSFPLDVLYKGSKKAFWFENHLALNVVIRGYYAIRIRDRAIAPTVYHTVNVSSLTRSEGFSQEFWLNFDRSINFWRLKMYGLKCSFFKYVIGQLIISRKKFLPRFSAFLYTFFLGFYYYLRYRRVVRAYFIGAKN
ncbi:MAG: glycosyltransferase [Nitrososphaeria archaeon]